MKLRLLVKSILMLLLVFVGFHIVSMSHLNHPTNQAKVLAVETESSFTTINLQEDDQKHFNHLDSIQVKDPLILQVVIITLFIFSSIRFNQKIRYFLYSVYYQSSYFSRNHLFTA
ncbi:MULTISPECIES: hypothetical protein [Metabacillus]|uniref:Uncharacterized protein n=2 Tax=Metabacillus TaxID=2675233 RepID=A0A179SMD6_9BACI|nr:MULTISPECIES: hypothetical protein [Metabacillus]OAS82100.1 hypothetical protein A6K24_13655 [Metabacillus litoralis]QNF29765.1 hypothetical protein HUW50_21095 [Metabacillus sp. KUDC1714]